jgi:GABA(A) receptor-associated protein
MNESRTLYERGQLLIAKYPDRVPVIINQKKGSRLTELDKNKYLMHRDIKVSEFMSILRKKLKIEASQGIFIFVDNKLPIHSMSFGELYDMYKDPITEFLYITYSSESVFG